MEGGAWKAAVHGVAKSRTRLSDFTFTFHFHALEKEMATHSSVLARRIPGTGEPVLPSMGLHGVGHDWSDLAAAAARHKKCYARSEDVKQDYLRKICFYYMYIYDISILTIETNKQNPSCFILSSMPIMCLVLEIEKKFRVLPWRKSSLSGKRDKKQLWTRLNTELGHFGRNSERVPC